MTLVNIDKAKFGFDVKSSWQVRAYAKTRGTEFGMLVLSVIAQTYDDAVWVLEPHGIRAPFICTAGKISRDGRVYCDQINKDEESWQRLTIPSEHHLQNKFRQLADELKLSDADRVEMFAAVKNWIVCDYRIDPNTGAKEERVA